MYAMVHFYKMIVLLVFLFVELIQFSKCSLFQGDYLVNYVNGVVGGSARMSCNTTPEYDDGKVMVILWFKENDTVPFYNTDLRGPEVSETSVWGARVRFYQLNENEANIELKNLVYTDAGLYSCKVNFASSPTQSTVSSLQVIVPPQSLTIVYKGYKVNNDKVGPFEEGDTVRVKCIAIGGNPQPQVVWWKGHEMLDDVSISISKKRVLNELIVSDIKRSDVNMVLTCRANNNNITTPLTTSVTVEMNLGPQAVLIYTQDGPTKVNTTQWFACRVIGANPPPEVTWIKDRYQISDLEQNITLEKNGTVLISVVKMTTNYEDNGQNISCCAPSHKKGTDYTCSKYLTFDVYYPPIVSLLVNGKEVNETTIQAGENITISCNITANPWIYDFAINKDNSVLITNEVTETSCPLYIASEPGIYACLATNREGTTMSSNMKLNVQYKPYCEDDYQYEIGTNTNTTVNITCIMKSNPRVDSYTWYYKNDTDCIIIDTTETNGLELYVEDMTDYGDIECSGTNVAGESDNEHRCRWHITDRAPPLPPQSCYVIRRESTPSRIRRALQLYCPESYHNNVHKYTLSAVSADNNQELWSISGPQSNLTLEEPPNSTIYKLILTASNDEGSSPNIVFNREDIIDENNNQEKKPEGTITSLSSLATWLALSVTGLILCACSLALCAQPALKSSFRRNSNQNREDAISNVSSNNSETSSENILRRTQSFPRQSKNRLPSNFNIHRTSSYRTPVCLTDGTNRPDSRHSVQNICGSVRSRRDLEAICGQLMTMLPNEQNYSIPKLPTSFYTIPRRLNSKQQFTETDNISLNSQGIDKVPLPPPPEEFQTLSQLRHEHDINNPFREEPDINVVDLQPELHSGNIYSYPNEPTLQRYYEKNKSTFKPKFSMENISYKQKILE